MAALLLTPSEKTLYEAISESLRDGWDVEDETLENYERPEELEMRFHMADFTDPECHELLEVVKKANDTEDLVQASASFNITSLPQEQLAELCFVLGTRVLSHFITYLLKTADTDEDIEGIAALSQIRHMLFESNAEVS